MQLLSVFASFQHVLHLCSTCFLCLFSIFSRIFPIVVPCNFHTGLPERIPDRLRSKARLAILGALDEAASRTCKNDEGIHSTKKKTYNASIYFAFVVLRVSYAFPMRFLCVSFVFSIYLQISCDVSTYFPYDDEGIH